MSFLTRSAAFVAASMVCLGATACDSEKTAVSAGPSTPSHTQASSMSSTATSPSPTLNDDEQQELSQLTGMQGAAATGGSGQSTIIPAGQAVSFGDGSDAPGNAKVTIACIGAPTATALDVTIAPDAARAASKPATSKTVVFDCPEGDQAGYAKTVFAGALARNARVDVKNTGTHPIKYAVSITRG